MSGVDISPLDVSLLTHDKLNKIALSGGRVCIVEEPHKLGTLPNDLHGYGFKSIPINGNHERLLVVLIPRCNEAVEYLRQGRIKRLMEKHDIDYATADSIHSASANIKNGMEHDVIEYVLETQHLRSAWIEYPGHININAMIEWADKWKMPPTRLRLDWFGACAEIAKNLDMTELANLR